MNPIAAAFWMMMNIGGNLFKKIFYVKKFDVQADCGTSKG